jgi:hypothetical protein
VTIDVLQDDNDHAVPDRRLRSRRGALCPVARAACRALGLTRGSVTVGSRTVRIWGWKDHTVLGMAATQQLAWAIQRFDKDGGMRPDRFRLTLNPIP